MSQDTAIAPAIAPADSTAQATCITVPPMKEAMPPRSQSPLYDSGTISLVLAILFLLLVTYGNGKRYISDLFHNMFSVRIRENLFEDHTMKETQTLSLLIANTCVFEGIILHTAFTTLHGAAAPVFPLILALSAAAALFYLAQLALYYALGYTFAGKTETKIWIDGFKASQSLLGIILAPVAIVMLICPQVTQTMLFVAVLLYFSARIEFVCKGFRIFFNNLSSLLYFILYLCSVEIVPVILSFAGAMNLCVVIQQAV